MCDLLHLSSFLDRFVVVSLFQRSLVCCLVGWRARELLFSSCLSFVFCLSSLSTPLLSPFLSPLCVCVKAAAHTSVRLFLFSAAVVWACANAHMCSSVSVCVCVCLSLSLSLSLRPGDPRTVFFFDCLLWCLYSSSFTLLCSCVMYDRLSLRAFHFARVFLYLSLFRPDLYFREGNNNNTKKTHQTEKMIRKTHAFELHFSPFSLWRESVALWGGRICIFPPLSLCVCVCVQVTSAVVCISLALSISARVHVSMCLRSDVKSASCWLRCETKPFFRFCLPRFWLPERTKNAITTLNNKERMGGIGAEIGVVCVCV